MDEEYEIRYLQSPFLMEHHKGLKGYRQYIFDTTSDYLLSVVNKYGLHGYRNDLYEIAKVSCGEVLSEPIRGLTVDKILKIVNKENEYG